MLWLECNENDTPGLSGDHMHKDKPLLSSKNQGWKIIVLWLLSQTYFLHMVIATFIQASCY